MAPAATPTAAAAADATAVVKADATRRYTFAPLYIPDTLDAHGEHTDADTLQRAVWSLVRKGDLRLRLEHDTDVVVGEIVELVSWPFEVTAALTLPDGVTKTAATRFPAGTVFMGAVWEPWAWPLVTEGLVKGWSMGGRAKRVTVDLPAAKAAFAAAAAPSPLPLEPLLAAALATVLKRRYVRDNIGRFAVTPGGALGGATSAPGGGSGAAGEPSASRPGPVYGSSAAAMEQRGDGERPMPAGRYPEGDPRNDPDYESYTQRIDAVIQAELTTNGDSRTRNSVPDPADPSRRVYTPERQADHQRILDQIMADNAAVPTDRQAVIMGGPPGAGKSTFVRNHGARLGLTSDARGNPTNAIVINPDEMKTVLLNGRGADGRPLIPDVPGLKRGEMAMLVHEESSHLANLLAARAMAEGRNVVFDVTLGSGPKARAKYLDPARAQGYSVTAAFIDGDLATSRHRAGLRHKQPNRETGERGMSGRYVPYPVINAQAPRPGARTSDGRPARSQNRVEYDGLVAEGVFDQAIRVDNVTGEIATDVARGGAVVTPGTMGSGGGQ